MLLKAPFGPYSGWGQDGIGLAEAAGRAGIEQFILPVEMTPPVPRSVASRLAKPLTPPFDLFLAHVGADRSALTPAELSSAPSRVLWSMWEWTSFENHPAIETIRRGLRCYDAVAVYDPVSAGAFRPLMPPDVPLLEVQGGFDPTPWRFIKRTWCPPVRFFAGGHLTDRKNPAAALDAFTQLLEEHGSERFDAELHFKVIDRNSPFLMSDNSARSSHFDAELLPAPSRAFVESAVRRERVFFHAGTWSRRVMRSFYARMHCMLAPSRGEGKNLMALEFLTTGGTVIATSFGGHTVWLDESYAYPLRCGRRPATWPIVSEKAQEADPDVKHLKELMWRVYANLEEAREKGRRAASIVPSKCSWDVALRRLLGGLASAGLDVVPPLAPEGDSRVGMGGE